MAIGPKISKTIINNNTLEVINQNINEYVVNTIVKNAGSCSSSAGTYNEMIIGNVELGGKDNIINVKSESLQDIELTLNCLQQSIQQTEIGKDIATSIMNQLMEHIDNDIMTKLINSSSPKYSKEPSNPFAPTRNNIAITSTDYQETDTTRKLSNLVVNRVSSNLNVSDIKNCFLRSSQSISQKIGDMQVYGEENRINIKMTGKQVIKSFATCKQLTEQTSYVMTQILTDLGVEVSDTTINKSVTEIVIPVKKYDSNSGQVQNIIYSVLSVVSLLIMLIVIFIVSRKKSKKSKNFNKYNKSKNIKKNRKK
jgi:hypothetical protein